MVGPGLEHAPGVVDGQPRPREGKGLAQSHAVDSPDPQLNISPGLFPLIPPTIPRGELVTISISVLLMRRLRHRENKYLRGGNQASRWQSQDSNEGVSNSGADRGVVSEGGLTLPRHCQDAL